MFITKKVAAAVLSTALATGAGGGYYFSTQPVTILGPSESLVQVTSIQDIVYNTSADVTALQGDILTIAERRKDASPTAWANAHNKPAPEGDEFVRLVALDAQASGINAGVNGKRGNVNDLSQDVIVFPVKSGGAGDASGRYPGIVIIDLIVGAGGSNPSISWGDVTQETINQGTQGAYVQPWADGGDLPGIPPTIPPPSVECPACPPPGSGSRPGLPPDSELANFQDVLNDYYGSKLERAPMPTHVDSVGRGRWSWDYQDLRAQGMNHQEATDEVMRRIVDITGVPR